MVVRDIVIFLAGMQLFHTLSHILLAISGTLPLRVFSLTIDQQMNTIIIFINIGILVLLIWYLYRK